MARRRRTRPLSARTATRPESPEDLVRRRARRARRRGEHRKAANALRELAGMTGAAAAWVSLGASLSRARRQREALDAYRQAMFLHRREGSVARARSVARLILEIDPADAKAERVLRTAAV